MQASIIIPAYNEEKRIVPFLKDLLNFSEKNLDKYELIIVNDGSKDKTLDIVKELLDGKKNARIVSYADNKGKGFAVKSGFEAAKYDLLIFIDADGSISPNEIPKMLEKLKKYDVVIGSRTLNQSDVKYTLIRKLNGTIFNYLVNLLFFINVNDTLCGFKGFKKEIAKNLFNDLFSKRWIFDVEIFYKMRKNGYSLCEIPIVWRHKEGSKIKFQDPFKIFINLLRLRFLLLFYKKIHTKQNFNWII